MNQLPEDLPPFSPYGSVSCRMCGSERISAKYLATGRCLHSDSGHEIIARYTDPGNPRMHRECDECGNVWDERTLENSPETQTQLAQKNARRSTLETPRRPMAPKP